MAHSDQEYQRPKEEFPFKWGGLKTNSTPNSMPPNKFPYAQNIRASRDSSLHTRYGTVQQTVISGRPTDMETYTQIQTDNLPRVLVRGDDDKVWLGKNALPAVQVGTLSGAGASPGAALIPFRPAQSPAPWMYVANGQDYQKFSAPAAGTDTVTAAKVGIAEPQTAPDAATSGYSLEFLASNPGYTHGGTAGTPVNTNRITDTIQSVFQDPGIPGNGYPTLGVSTGQYYTRQMMITVSGAEVMVRDVYPGQPTLISIVGVYYYTGSTGRCVIVPSLMGAGVGTNEQSISQQSLLGTLRRGSLIAINAPFPAHNETCIVWDVVEGPNGTVCIETSTVNAHAAGETFSQPPAIQVTTGGVYSVGAPIACPTVGFPVGTGIGYITTPPGIGQIFSTSVQPDDYVHMSLIVDNLVNLIELKIMFDVDDGSFNNMYYYTVRASDIAAAVANTSSQLGAAQLVTQRAMIDGETPVAVYNQLKTGSSLQTVPGSNQWTEIVFRISDLTRVGGDQTRTLQNLNAVQILVNASGNLEIAIGSICTWGGYSPDVGTNSAPYLYRVRPRSSVTGVKGNPSPETRYGVNPRRELVLLALPSAAYDSQIDTWDIFRYGGSVTSWRKIGQCASTTTQFEDNYTDEAALAGESLDLDNLQPWPTVDVPYNLTVSQVTGVIALVTAPPPTNILRLLPGNLVQIGGINVYTLRQRPTLVSGNTYLLQFVENAGITAGPALIYEPLIAQQYLPYMWGPDATGTVFAVGDPLRPGTFSTTKNYAPDAAPDAYNQELTAPSEPLLGGEIVDGLSFVASPEHWWALYPQQDNPTQRYNPVQQPIPRGLAAPYGHCTDGKAIYFWAKDGIWATDKGSLTDADLSNLFPHDGVAGSIVIYGGYTIYPPDYSRSATFRLTHSNGYLYAVYQDSSGTYRTLTLDLRRGAWCLDVYTLGQVACYCHPDQPEGSLLTSGTLYPMLLLGAADGSISVETALTDDNGSPIVGALATMEWDAVDARAGKQWGDVWLDCSPGGDTGITVTPMAMGSPLSAPVVIPRTESRVQTPVSVGGEVLSDYLGVLLQWQDSFGSGAGGPQVSPTTLNTWQPSLVPKPETIQDRITDWYGGSEGARYMQGFLLHADTGNVAKGIAVRDSDTLTTHAFTPTVQHNGESIKAYSFLAPFIAHQVRIEPTDQAPWRFFDVEWVSEPTPETAETWQTQGTSFGFNGYSHIPRIVAAYASTVPITLTITSYDGQSPAAVTLPSTTGAYQKKLVVLTANKGQLYFFAAQGSAPFQFYLDDWEIIVGNWGRQGGYLTWKSLGAPHGVKALV